MADRRREKEKLRERHTRDHRERDRDRDRHFDRDRDRDRDRDWDRDRDRAKDWDRDKRKRSRSPDQHRRRSPLPEPRRSRSRSVDRSNRRHSHHRRSPSPDANRRKRRREGSDDEHVRQRSTGPDSTAANVGAKNPKKAGALASGGAGADVAAEPTDVDNEELEMMKMMGIPVGFDSTKGKQVPGADVSGVRSVSKRQPRQYMNRRGGFNRPLPAERNR